jgi:hypothetical protein
MTVVILAEAEREFAESAAYYESKEAGLGWRFRTEVVEAVGWIEICEHFRITLPTSFAVRPS